MKTITKNEASEMVKNYNKSQVFSVIFVKRTTGEIRKMSCRKGVKKYLTGGELKYDLSQKNLVGVFDMNIREYRTIPLENIQQVSIKHEKYKVE